MATQLFNSPGRPKEITLSVKLCYFSPKEIGLMYTTKKVAGGSSLAAQTEIPGSNTLQDVYRETCLLIGFTCSESVSPTTFSVNEFVSFFA